MKNAKEMKTDELKEFFEKAGFNVYLSEQDGNQCAEVEMWTNGGVDMVIWLNPFTVEEFKKCVNDFNVDDEVDNHRQDNMYKIAFTISQALEDFTAYHNHLKDVVKQIDKMQ